MKNSKYTIGNRTRDLPACSAGKGVNSATGSLQARESKARREMCENIDVNY